MNSVSCWLKRTNEKCTKASHVRRGSSRGKDPVAGGKMSVRFDPYYHILYSFHDLDIMTWSKKRRQWWFPNLEEYQYYYFRHRPFKIKDILDIFLREYLKELFRYYEHYRLYQRTKNRRAPTKGDKHLKKHYLSLSLSIYILREQ